MKKQSTRKSMRNPLADRVDILFDELKLAIQWQRPSILLAIYDSDLVRWKADIALKQRLKEIGQNITRYSINEELSDISQVVSQSPRLSKTVYFISDLKWGGGKHGFAAYRALNLHREFFVDNKIRVVFWLTKTEAADLPHQAPDFWSFRHRVVEFLDTPAHGVFFPSFEKLIWENLDIDINASELDDMIALRKSMLTNVPENPESMAARAELFYELAFLSSKKDENHLSIEFLSRGLELATQLGDTIMQSRYWVGLGIIYQHQNDHKGALAATKKAIDFNRNNFHAWSNLAIINRIQRRVNKAIQACRKAIELNPNNDGPWNSLGNAYRDLGLFEDALASYRSAIKCSPKNADPWKNIGMTYRIINRNKEALRSVRKGLRLSPQDSKSWNILGHLYLDLERVRDAIGACKKAIALDPNHIPSRLSLATCYHELRLDVQRTEQLQIVRSKIPFESEYIRACFEAVCGNADEAMELLRAATRSKQESKYMIRRDPNLNSLHGDPRFDELVENG